MYSAMILSVESERSRLMRSVSRDIANNSEEHKQQKTWEISQPRSDYGEDVNRGGGCVASFIERFPCGCRIL